MAKPAAIRPEEEFARSYVDRLILEKLTEMESAVKLGELADRLAPAGIGLATVRSLLASNPDRFAYHERRWIPASRLEGLGKPFVEAMRIVLSRHGGPLSVPILATEIARIRKSDEEQTEAGVRRLAVTDERFVLTPNNEVALTEWGFVATDQPLARALALNGVSQDEFNAVKAKVGGINFRTAESVADAVRATAPVKLKVLGAVAYATLNQSDPRSVLMYDAREFFTYATTVPGYLLAPDGGVYAEEEARKWVNTAVRIAERLAPTVEVEDAAPLEIKTEDIDRLIQRVLGNETSTTAIRLLEEFYEITPGTKTFPDDLSGMMSVLKSQSQIQWVGGDRFRRKGDVPDYMLEVPEPFQFTQSDVQDAEGELIDVELTDEGLSSSLRKLLSHPLALDVLDEDIQPAPKTIPDQVRLVLKSIHRELGTFALAQIPTGWLDPEPILQELIVVDPSGREVQIWANQDARLLYGFFDWWYEQPIESGAVFTLTKTLRPNVLEFEWLDQPDPVVYISAQRMEELRTLGANSEGKSTLDLLIEVMGHWPKGADYLTVLAELNVVRRSSRRLVASLLSSYQCFYQRSGSPVWHFDPKKVELGFDKTKRKFIRK